MEAAGRQQHGSKAMRIAALILISITGALEQTAIAAASPSIASDLGGQANYAWIATANLLALTSAMPVWGRAGDHIGHGRVLLQGVAVMSLGSILCACAGAVSIGPAWFDGMAQLTFARMVQAIGIAAIAVSSPALLATMLTPLQRARWIGIFSLAAGTGATLGPLLGGAFAEHGDAVIAGVRVAGWRWPFLMAIPMSLVSMTILFCSGSWPRVAEREKRASRHVLLGAPSLIPAVIGISTAGISRHGAWYAVVGISITVLWVSAYLKHYGRREDSLLPMDLFRNRSFTTTTLALFFACMSFACVIAYLPLHAQRSMNASPTEAGAILMPILIGMFAGGALASAIVSKFGRLQKAMAGGGASMGIGLLVLSTASPLTSAVLLSTAAVAVGMGFGFIQALASLNIQNAADPERMGITIGASRTIAQVGDLLGAVAFGVVFTVATSRDQASWIAMGMAVAAVVAALSAWPSLVGPVVRFNEHRQDQRMA